MAGVNKQDQREMRSLFGDSILPSKNYCVFQFVLRIIKNELINAEKQKHFHEYKLLITIFNNLKEFSPITFQEIKLLSLLWISFIQHR